MLGTKGAVQGETAQEGDDEEDKEGEDDQEVGVQ